MKALLRHTRPLPGVLCALTLCVVSGSAVLVTTGCGGGGNKASVSATRKAGRATLTLVWPSSGTRLIPAAAQSVVVTVVDDQGNRYSTPDGSPLVLPRPAGDGTSSATFDPLPVGTLTVTATAYPNNDGTGTAQATATGPLVVQADRNSTVTLTMQSTIDHITVSPPTASIPLDGTTQFSATAYDAAGNMVLVVPGSLVFAATKAGYAQPVSGDAASGNIHGVGVGTVGVTATDPESGKAGQASLTVKRTAAYSITLIRETDTFASTNAVAINDSGQVLGNIHGYGFLWTPDKDTGLHVLSGQATDIVSSDGAELTASGLNDLGQVVGSALNAGGVITPFSWVNGQLAYYNIPSGTASGSATAINNSGVIAGQGRTSSGVYKSCTWTLNTPTPNVISSAPTNMRITSLNNSGLAIGTTGNHGELVSLDSQGNLIGTITALPDLSGTPPPLPFSTAIGVSSLGDVVGASMDKSGKPQAVIWPKEGGVLPLAWIDNGVQPYAVQAYAVNKKQQAVGASLVTLGDKGRAVLWQAGVAHDLNSMIPSGTSWILYLAQGINNRGQITSVTEIKASSC